VYRKIWLIGSSLLLVVAVLACMSIVLAEKSPAPALAAPVATTPSVTVVNPIVKLETNAKVVILGSGFEPGQKIRLLLKTSGNINDMTDDALDPELVVNDDGAWATVLTCDRLTMKYPVSMKYTLSNVVGAIEVTDNAYNTLAHAPVAFYDAKKPREEWPSWAIATVPE